MNDAAIFAIGSVLFIATTWATIAFLLVQVRSTHRDQILEDPGVSVVEEGPFTERYVKDD